ncbi:GGDEF domain-containing protein [Marinobacter sp. F4216]|uniref:GGDEF domain-containing protein n=1 Tax=Marinobacter sp. F4216 TaxID=2874281 RepID=UPI001CBF6843|nr:GGDEF domain-containing protein [Marinobacter sp. F4216]MBZ2169407.1 GGDEF domain-containing protein [Marinobacter sp. F4216]
MDLANNPYSPSSGPTLAVLKFKQRLVFHLYSWTLIAAAPLLIIRWQQDHLLLTALLLLFCLNALLVMGFLHFRGTYFLKGRLFPLLAIMCSVYSTAVNGHIGLYWAYPIAVVFFFLLPLREAIASNILFLILLAVVSYLTFPEADVWRITFSLALTCLFALVSAWLVGKIQQELVRLATTDPLTGCLNRSQLSDLLNNQIQMRERYERVSSAVLIDLDFFKAVNDQWGHLAGDRILQELVTRIRGRLRETDQLFRIGGEEFMVLLPETRQKDAENLANQLLLTIRSKPFFNEIRVTASVSVAEVCRGETWSAWLNRADQALYEAKARGRNRVEIAPNSPSDQAPDPSGQPAPATS